MSQIYVTLLDDISGTQILRSEKENAVKRMKSGKAAGENRVVMEMIESATEFMIENIAFIANRIYDEGYSPEAIRESVFVSIPRNQRL